MEEFLHNQIFIIKIINIKFLKYSKNNKNINE